MATLAQISEAIKAKLLSVPGIGQVHDYERFVRDLASLRAHYESGGRINGWWFRRERTAEEDLNSAEVRRVDRWVLRGYYALDDEQASEKTFQALVEAIKSAFRADRTLGGLVLDIKDLDNEFGPAGVQVDRIGAVMFGSALCHDATLILITESTEPSV